MKKTGRGDWERGKGRRRRVHDETNLEFNTSGIKSVLAPAFP